MSTELRWSFAASDWTYDYAPKLGIGSFAVFEIPEIAADDAGLTADLKKAAEAGMKAKLSLQSGQWDDVCLNLRQVWEILKRDRFIEDIVTKDGYSPEAAGFLCGALQNFFNLASKFDHALARDQKTILPTLTARKEDAYLVFGSAMAALNLIAKKARRAGMG